MGIFELVITLLLVGAVLALWADKAGIPYPALLALAGAALTLIPGTPQIVLDPRLALALFVSPVLLDAAFDASPRDLKQNLVAVSSLALIAVGMTIVAVAFVAKHLVPGISWPAAVALGAIVAPPDTSAATTVLRRLRPPHRLMVILQGESLFNDASALLVYRFAVAAAMTGTVSGWSVVPMFLITCGGGVVLGIVLARVYLWATTHVDDIPVSVILQFIGTFAVWLLADHLGLSAILTVIAYAMTLARRAGRVDARHRISSYAVWDVAVFVLNVLAFVMIGLQLRGIVTRMKTSDWHTYLVCAGAVCLTVVVVRILWVMVMGAVAQWKIRHFHGRQSMTMPTLGGALIVAWCGMRGIVTLAAALALPDGSPTMAFPYRDLIILCAFCVVLTTLVIQGMTLRPLLKWAGLKDDGSVDREIQLARAETARAALKVLAGHESRPAIETLRRGYEARVRLGQGQSVANQHEHEGSNLGDLQRRAVNAQREALIDLRARSIIGDDAFHAAEEEIDLLELAADERIRPQA
ncbi:MAG: Na+/H+ antiporter [Gammaproteobacteria bacterium]|jgi:Na+/H+ antiporter|nr:Na+/H+ antiporter [Gammaproteobacteria bacterium]